MEYDNRTDAELAVLARQGDTSAFEALVRRYFGAVYGLAYGWTRNAQDAEDLTQEAFYRAFERLRSLRDPSSFPAWLRTLTRTCAACGTARGGSFYHSTIPNSTS